MPRTTEQQIEELVKVTEDARQTIKELREERASTVDVLKKHKERITHLLIEEVTKQVSDISDEARKQMFIAFEEIVDNTNQALKEKLGI